MKKDAKFLWKEKQRLRRITERERRESDMLPREKQVELQNKILVHKENDADLNCPQWGVYVGLISAVVSFFGANSFYCAAEDYLLAGVSNSLIVIAVKMGLLLSYLIPIVIGAFLLRSKQAIIQVVGCLFAGIGFGIVFRITLQVVSMINPYNL